MSASNRSSVFLDVLIPVPIRNNKLSFPHRLSKLEKNRYYSQALSETDKKALAAGVKNHNHKHWSWEYAKSIKKDCPALFPEDSESRDKHGSRNGEKQPVKEDKVRPFSWAHRRHKSSPLVQVINADEIQDEKQGQNKHAASTPVSPLLTSPRRSLSPKSSFEGPVSGQFSTPATTMSSKPSQRRRRFSFESDYDELADGNTGWTKLPVTPVEVAPKTPDHRRQSVTFDDFLSPHKSGKDEAYRGASNALSDGDYESDALRRTKRSSQAFNKRRRFSPSSLAFRSLRSSEDDSSFSS